MARCSSPPPPLDSRPSAAWSQLSARSDPVFVPTASGEPWDLPRTFTRGVPYPTLTLMFVGAAAAGGGAGTTPTGRAPGVQGFYAHRRVRLDELVRLTPLPTLYSGGTACGSRPGAVPASRPDADPDGPGRLPGRDASSRSGRGTRRPGHPDGTRTPTGTPGRSGRAATNFRAR